MSQLVVKLDKLTHLDISRTSYSHMPPQCSWPSTLRYLNISGAKLTSVTSCLAETLEVLRVDLAAVMIPTPQTLTDEAVLCCVSSCPGVGPEQQRSG